MMSDAQQKHNATPDPEPSFVRRSKKARNDLATAVRRVGRSPPAPPDKPLQRIMLLDNVSFWIGRHVWAGSLEKAVAEETLATAAR
jgi:hypothetical protein